MPSRHDVRFARQVAILREPMRLHANLLCEPEIFKKVDVDVPLLREIVAALASGGHVDDLIIALTSVGSALQLRTPPTGIATFGEVMLALRVEKLADGERQTRDLERVQALVDAERFNHENVQPKTFCEHCGGMISSERDLIFHTTTFNGGDTCDIPVGVGDDHER